MPRIGNILDRRLRTLTRGIFAAICIALFASETRAQRPLDANTPASIAPPAVAVPPNSNKPAPAADATTRPAAATLADRPVTPIPVPPASESRALGKPNGALAARPATQAPPTVKKDAANESGGGFLRALDPRQNDFTRVLGALAAVVGLILLVRTLAVRLMPSLFNAAGERPSGVIEILARYPAGRGQQLIVLKFARRILLIHQAGATARTLTEMTDPDEVAATLSRLEAGAPTRSAAKFKAALQSFTNEHEAAMAQRSRSGAALAAAETEIIDLTRTQIRKVGSMSGARRLLR